MHAVNREVARNEGLALARPLTNLVFMGMGEPLHNFEHLKDALHVLQSEDGPELLAPAHHRLHRGAGPDDRPARARRRT